VQPGGNIGAVSAGRLLSNKIHADFYLTSVTTTGSDLVGTTIEAQGGGTLNAAGIIAAREAIMVDLVGVFNGKIHFTYSSRIPDSLAARYSRGFRSLLTFTDALTSRTTWQADNAPEGVADVVTLKDAIFQYADNQFGPQGYGAFLLNGEHDDNWHIDRLSP
jgi:hypothetical protein